jgi:hypothetical protein
MDTASCEGTLSLSTILRSSPEPDCSESRKLVGEWLARFATNAGHPLDDGRTALWRDELSGVEPVMLERAFRAVLRAQVFNCMPAIGAIWQKVGEVRQAEAEATERVAREKWLSNQPPWEELHSRGRAYCARVTVWAREIAELQRSQSKTVTEPIPLVIATRERLGELEEQTRIILARYPSQHDSRTRAGA